jgi:hypothetical protein
MSLVANRDLAMLVKPGNNARPTAKTERFPIYTVRHIRNAHRTTPQRSRPRIVIGA